MWSSQRGMSMVELLTVMTVAGLLVALAGEGFVSAASHYRAKGMAAEVAGELRAARYLALMRGERLKVVFDVEQMKIRTEPADRPNESIRQYDYQGKGITFERLPSGPSVTFYPSGRTASPATIILRNSRQQQWKITVSLTGKVSLS
jgi:type IV fimbrial biogenesis protein FimT